MCFRSIPVQTCAVVGGAWLTREEQPQLSSHAFRDALEDELLGLVRAVHAHALTVLCKMVLPRLLFQELLGLCSQTHTQTNKYVKRCSKMSGIKKKNYYFSIIIL